MGVSFKLHLHSSALGGQKTVFNPLGLELQIVGSSQMDAGNWTTVLWKSSQGSDCWVIPLAVIFDFF